jgi:hypothetical protein
LDNRENRGREESLDGGEPREQNLPQLHFKDWKIVLKAPWNFLPSLMKYIVSNPMPLLPFWLAFYVWP